MSKSKTGRFENIFASTESAFVMQTLLLVAFVAGASYAETSNLFTAYLAGIVISWWYGRPTSLDSGKETSITPRAHAAHQGREHTPKVTTEPGGQSSRSRKGQESSLAEMPSVTAQTREKADALTIFTVYFDPAVSRILKPFFFVSCYRIET